MADQLNVNGLSLADGNQQGQPRSYIPPHMRARQNAPPPAAAAPPPTNGGPPAAVNGGMNNSSWSG